MQYFMLCNRLVCHSRTGVAKIDGVPRTRGYGLAFSRTLLIEDSSLQSDLQIYNDGKEPVDVLC